ncbi:MAG: 4-alpha-glucanotransferase [Acidimicrobiales bacterium]
MPPDEGIDLWGIQAGYHDVFGRWSPTAPATAAALRAAMGAEGPDQPGPPRATPLRVVRVGEEATTEVTERATLFLEDGSTVRLRHGRLPRDLPLGVHRVEAEAGRSAPHVEHLVVAPDRARVPEVRRWGITAQLYATRSRRSWGIGDLRDLGDLVSWTEARGGATVGLNPLHAHSPGGPPPNSPYSPSSRRWLDPIYLDVEALAPPTPPPGWDDAVAAGRALAGTERIDRAAAWEAKLAALALAWPAHRADPELAAWRAERGGALDLWATYCAIAEVHGPSWPAWPEDLRRPRTPAVARFAADSARADRVAFWAWLQWCAERQLAAAGAGRTVITDLAVGFAADGFDAWDWQDLLATGVHVGAPPDLLGPDGQDWGLPPLVPWKVRGLAYAPVRETLRANLRHGIGVRIDHVMGLLRLFWIPPGGRPADGAYVHGVGSELVDLVALESARAGGLVVGEDLGTVEPGTRDLLRERGLLSTRLLWFEDEPASAWPTQAQASITTHDLPTVAGAWTGTDLADQRAAGVTVPADGDELFRHRLRVAGACDDSATVDHVAVAAHAAIGSSPCLLATAALDDLLGAVHRPNVPGTIDEHPNWRIPLPHPIEALDEQPLASAIVEAIGQTRPHPGPAT